MIIIYLLPNVMIFFSMLNSTFFSWQFVQVHNSEYPNPKMYIDSKMISV